MFPQMNRRFEAFVEPAKSQRSGWFVILGLCLIVIFYLEFMYLLLFLFAAVIGGGDGIAIGFAQVSRMLGAADTPLALNLALATFIGMFGAVTLMARVTRERSPMSLIGTGPIVRNMFVVILALGTLISVSTVFAHVNYDLQPNLPFSQWIRWLPLAIPLLFIQIAAEEMIFRGYFQQELAARFKSPLVWMFVPSVVFGSLHWDSETYGSNAWLIVGSTTLFGVFAADLTARTGNLGAAFGLHFTNNFSAMFVTSMQGKMSGLSLYTTPFGANDNDAIRILMIWDIGLMLTTYLIYLFAIRFKRVA